VIFFRFEFSRKNLVSPFSCCALFLLTHSSLPYSRLWCGSTVRSVKAENLDHNEQCVCVLIWTTLFSCIWWKYS